MKTIGILYICTGKYAIFFDSFFKSCEQYFLPNCKKQYFVFTDQKINVNNKNCHFIYQKKLGWPFDTLLRYHMFYEQFDKLKKMDYLFFFNANALVQQEITENILPEREGLMGVLHPGFYNKERVEFTYENNPESLAYIKQEEGLHYFMGGFNGGTTKDFLELSYLLARNIEDDLDNGIIAIWHDESHLNRYFIDHIPKILSCAYGYPEDWELPFEKKILLRDKNKFGGHLFLRT